MFFVVKPISLIEWQHAMFILSYYHVDIAAFSNGDDPLSTYMVVGAIHPKSERIKGQDINPQEQLRLAEMAFQLNWHQVGNLCPHCHCTEVDVCASCVVNYSCDDVRGDCGVKAGPTTCGHLTFNRPIIPAF